MHVTGAVPQLRNRVWGRGAVSPGSNRSVSTNYTSVSTIQHEYLEVTHYKPLTGHINKHVL